MPSKDPITSHCGWKKSFCVGKLAETVHRCFFTLCVCVCVSVGERERVDLRNHVNYLSGTEKQATKNDPSILSFWICDILCSFTLIRKVEFTVFEFSVVRDFYEFSRAKAKKKVSESGEMEAQLTDLILQHKATFRGDTKLLHGNFHKNNRISQSHSTGQKCSILTWKKSRKNSKKLKMSECVCERERQEK